MRVANLLAVLALCLPLPAPAEPPHDDPPVSPVAELLALQRSGRAASPHRQSLPGDAQTRVWKRYLDSFTHPIPSRYIDHGFKEN